MVKIICEVCRRIVDYGDQYKEKKERYSYNSFSICKNLKECNKIRVENIRQKKIDQKVFDEDYSYFKNYYSYNNLYNSRNYGKDYPEINDLPVLKSDEIILNDLKDEIKRCNIKIMIPNHFLYRGCILIRFEKVPNLKNTKYFYELDDHEYFNFDCNKKNYIQIDFDEEVIEPEFFHKSEKFKEKCITYELDRVDNKITKIIGKYGINVNYDFSSYSNYFLRFKWVFERTIDTYSIDIKEYEFLKKINYIINSSETFFTKHSHLSDKKNNKMELCIDIYIVKEKCIL